MTRRPIITAIVRLVSLLWVFCLPVFGTDQQRPASGRPPGGDPLVGERIAKGVAFDGRLWIRGTMPTPRDASGGLLSLGIKDNARQVHFDRGVMDIARSDRDLWILRRGSEAHRFTVSAWKQNRFEDLAEFQLSAQDAPLALLDDAGSPVVLSAQTIRHLAADRTWHVVELKGKLRSGVQVSAASPQSGGSVYIGFDVGEWGGGLQQVDLRTGTVTDIERRDTKELCDGPLNRECDPVTGVIPDPQNKDCVLASVGLVHLFQSNGRLLRICGQRVTLVFELLIPNSKNQKWKQTEAFYGLAPSADGGYWAITWRALYHFDAGGTKDREYTLPKLESVSGIHLSKALPGAIVLQTDVNWAVSTSGYTPLVVPLEDSRP